MPVSAEAALAAAEAAWPATLERLAALVRIPSCAFPGFDPVHVVASAEATAAWLRDAGYPEVRVEPDGGPHPAVIAHGLLQAISAVECVKQQPVDRHIQTLQQLGYHLIA